MVNLLSYQKLKLWKGLSHLVYPSVCLHCGDGVDSGASSYCIHCLEWMTLIEPEDRCFLCFGAKDLSKDRLCRHCCMHPPVLESVASALDYVGPPATLVKRIKYGNMPGLSGVAAAYMVKQLIDLEWPLPDVIVPVPIPWTRWLERGYNQSLLIAEEMGKILERPVNDVLGRRCGDYSQARLTKTMRQELLGETFYLKKNSNRLEDQRVLLVDDVLTTGTTLRRCGEVIQGECPRDIYGLTVCRGVQ